MTHPDPADGVAADAHRGARTRNGALLRQLEVFGDANDATTAERARRLLNVTPDTGAFLAAMVRATRARRILELGTSNGYSTVWLAEAAADTGGRVTTVEMLPEKAAMASETFARAEGLAPVELLVEDAGTVLARSDAGAWDLVFLDTDRERYAEWWPALRRALAPGGVLVVDNATSHPAEVAPLAEAIAAAPEFTWALLTVGKGELVACKRAG
jgi:predicted O-methyltransferase YrrM